MTFGDFGIPFMQDYNILALQVFAMTLSSMATFTQGVINAIKHTETRPKICVVSGLLPLVLYLNMFFMIFAFSNWAWNNCGYVTILMCPVFSLINSR